MRDGVLSYSVSADSGAVFLLSSKYAEYNFGFDNRKNHGYSATHSPRQATMFTSEKKGLENSPVPDGNSSPSSIAGEHVGVKEKALLTKLDMRLLPPLTILYLLSFLDRSNGQTTSTT